MLCSPLKQAVLQPTSCSLYNALNKDFANEVYVAWKQIKRITVLCLISSITETILESQDGGGFP